ncbi:MAG: hypothetical protein R2708_23520 [Vicinamibacterales bacterium]
MDATRIEELFLKAAESWPDSARLTLERARFLRYVWRGAEAIALLRELAKRVEDDDVRQEAIAELAECLLSLVRHGLGTSQTLGPADAKAFLNEAEEALVSVGGKRHGLAAIGLLTDRLALEQGKFVDWTAIDAVFEQVIGDVDGYLVTSLEHLDALVVPSPDRPAGIAAHVRENWTDIDALRSLEVCICEGRS